MASSSVLISAPAKINLYLAVSGLRADGYHDVSTVLQALEFGDELCVARADRFSFVSSPALDIPDADNLVTRAARELAATLAIEPTFTFRLAKRIPSGAGLGGGSADAAAALAGMATLLGLASDDPRVCAAAAAVGTDVPFFLTGGAALYGGRGEQFVRDLPTLETDVVLVKPPESISTAEAYAAFDRMPHSPAPGHDPVEDALRFSDRAALSSALYNNMTQAATGLVAKVQETLAWVDAREGVTGSLLCGSGSAVFALCEDAASAMSIAEQARARGMWSMATRTSRDGVRVRVEECP
ncbi:MAG: 4-(cytidine 5'-diphospho)-2-C-methyl-D-erythritol kinase [Actinobacteria bacterium HGW-Actinobacteria-10]|jgi:4-diphosphocytidyl-2-C-methyl-D-erythritol kinase|nr:MAG: 4-(cytidine 5'-diphospho)-2-C-methyl-D-erythritol kinase [Actinobacteria bacterium HGW-Actinobacteria-10]